MGISLPKIEVKNPFSSVIELISNLGGLYAKHRITKAEGKIMITAARVKAETDLLQGKSTGKMAWEATQASNSNSSWKDEYWTLVLGTPMILMFIPPLQPYIVEGFEGLKHVPEWYLYSVGAAMSAAFGIRGLGSLMAPKLKVKPA
jgi:hypothetical protein